MADEPDEPVPLRFPTLDDFRRPIMGTGQDAIDLGEVYLRVRYGEGELEAQRPPLVRYEGQTPNGISFILIVGSKPELTDVDFLGVPMRIGTEDGRLLGIGFHTGIGVPEEAWVPLLASPEPGPDSEDDGGDR